MASLKTPELTLSFSMSQLVIDQWAELSGDNNPLHVDPAYAATTKFGGTIAHGHIGLSLIHQMFYLRYGEQWLSAGSLESVKFTSPVRPGESYRISANPKNGVTGDPGPASDWSVVIEGVADGTVCATGRARLRQLSGLDENDLR